MKNKMFRILCVYKEIECEEAENDVLNKYDHFVVAATQKEKNNNDNKSKPFTAVHSHE